MEKNSTSLKLISIDDLKKLYGDYIPVIGVLLCDSREMVPSFSAPKAEVLDRTLSAREAYELITGEVEACPKKIANKLYNLRTYHQLEHVTGSRPYRYLYRSVMEFIQNNRERN